MCDAKINKFKKIRKSVFTDDNYNKEYMYSILGDYIYIDIDIDI